jgi:hypothetical protein
MQSQQGRNSEKDDDFHKSISHIEISISKILGLSYEFFIICSAVVYSLCSIEKMHFSGEYEKFEFFLCFVLKSNIQKLRSKND